MKLDNRIKELIAVGASVTANCQPCLEYHTDKALENGALREEIIEAVEIGKMVREGAASKMDSFYLRLIKNAASNASVVEEECGCKS